MRSIHLDLTECVKYTCQEVQGLDFRAGNRMAIDKAVEHLAYAMRLLEAIQSDMETEAASKRDAVIDGALAKLCPVPDFPSIRKGA